MLCSCRHEPTDAGVDSAVGGVPFSLALAESGYPMNRLTWGCSYEYWLDFTLNSTLELSRYLWEARFEKG